MTRHLLHIILIHLTINLFGQQGSSSYQFMLCDSGKTIECNSSSDFHIYTVHTYSKRTLNTESECRNWSYDNTKKAWDIFINWMNIPMAEIYIIKNKKDTMSILILISQEKLLLDLNSISYTKGKYSITTIPRTDIDNEMEKIVTDNKNYWKRQNELYANLQNQIKDNLEKNKPQPLPQTQQEIILEKDSFISIRDSFSTKDSITFTAKLSKDRKVPTSCCSSNDSINFRYSVHCLQNESWNRTRVECDRGRCGFTFHNGNKYSIPPIKNPGTYYLTILAVGFIITSNQFTVKQ